MPNIKWAEEDHFTDWMNLTKDFKNSTAVFDSGGGNTSHPENWNDNETCSEVSTVQELESSSQKIFWALLLIPLPLVAVVGNILVILSVYKERSLQTVTNYFIVSLAFADLLVAAVVMPFALYVLVNVEWRLSDMLCDFYIAVDVTCSTASIFNLVAISIDRFIAVTQPIKYSKHKNNKRVFLTIAIVWLVSAAIGSPIVLGLNTSPERIPQLCVFYNSDFIIYSSLSSFYIPCLVMVFLYYRIFKAIHDRARKAAAKRAPTLDSGTRGSRDLDIENVTHKERQQQSSLRPHLEVVLEADAVTNTGSCSIPDEDEDEDDTEERTTFPNGDDCCQVIQEPKASASAMLLSAVTETIRIDIPINGNADSGYGASNVEETQFCMQNPKLDSPKILMKNPFLSPSMNPTGPSSAVLSSRNGVGTGGILRNEAPSDRKKKSRFNLGRRHKSSRKKREKASAKRERKATKTLAIVLGMFLVSWVPFFTCNILDAICIKLKNDDFRPGVTVFLLTTWLGYINSCVNPVIYTIFNMEFRKAFKKLLSGLWSCCKAPGR